MFVLAGGRERSRDEYTELFGRAGLRHVSTALAVSGHALMEATVQ